MVSYSSDPSLDEVMSDDKLRFAFQTFLKRNHMAEILEIWAEFEELRMEVDDGRKIEHFRNICQSFVLPGCPKPVNLSCEVSETLKQLYCDLAVMRYDRFPMKMLKSFEHDLFALLEVSCLPSFLLSSIFQDVRNGVFMTSEEEFSRQKAEFFFGMKIEGSLRRQELLRIMPVKEKRFFVLSKKTGKSVIVQAKPNSPVVPLLPTPSCPTLVQVPDHLSPDHLVFTLDEPCIQGDGPPEAHGAGTVGLWDLVAKDLK